MLHCCQGIGTDVPDHAADAVRPDGFYDGNVEEGLKGHSDAANPSPQNQPLRPAQMNIGAGNHPFPKSFLDGDFEFVRSFVLCYSGLFCVCLQLPAVFVDKDHINAFNCMFCMVAESHYLQW